MELTIKPATRTCLWIVEAHGFSGDADGCNREKIYAGGSREAAIRLCLEAEALAQCWPSGRGGQSEYDYSRLVAPLFESKASRPDRSGQGPAPFAWAREGWSRDTTLEDHRDATIEGADLFWIDEHGAKLHVELRLNPREKAFLASVPAADPYQRYPIEALIAGLEALELESLTPDSARAGAKPSL